MRLNRRECSGLTAWASAGEAVGLSTGNARRFQKWLPRRILGRLPCRVRERF